MATIINQQPKQSKIGRLALYATLPLLILLCLAYFAAYEALKQVMPYVVYAGSSLIISIALVASIAAAYIIFEMVRTRKTQLWATREMARAEANRAMAIAQKEKVLVITAPKGHQLIVRDTDTESNYRQLHLNPNSNVNGHYERPNDLQVQLYRQYLGLPSGDDEPMVIEALPDGDILDGYGTDWIQNIVLVAPHVHYCGATRSGKTTLANHQITRIMQYDPDTRVYLLNPKDTAARKPFVIDPDYTDIGQAIEALEEFNHLMHKRKNDPTLDDRTPPIVFVIDEWDWIYSVHKQEAVNLLQPLVKVGAELKIKVILIGQSPLTGDTGLSQSFYHNMVRVAIWQEGSRLLNNYQLDRKYKAPLLGQYEQLKQLAPRYEMGTGRKLRYCLTIPMAGNPTVQVIPALSDPHPIAKHRIDRPKPTSQEREILLAWWSMRNDKDFSGNKLHREVSGLPSRANSSQLQKYRDLIEKFGEKPGF